MKKPVWLRVMGWAALLLALVSGWILYEQMAGSDSIGLKLSFGMVSLLGGFLFLLWGSISALLWFSRHNAGQMAAAFSNAARQGQAAPEAGGESLAGRFHQTVRRPADVVTPSPQASPRPVLTSPLGLSSLNPAPAADPPPDPWALIRGESCDVCGRGDVAPRLHCCRHETTVCFLCLVGHDARLECYYIPAGRAPRRQGARVAAFAG